MATTWPTVCRVLYESEPSPRCHDDDPFIPFRFSLLKSFGSTNSQEQLMSRHARHHDHAIQSSDRHGNASDASSRHGNKDRDKKSHQRQNEDISREFHSKIFQLTETLADEEQRKGGEDVNSYDQNESTNLQMIISRRKTENNKTKKKKTMKERFSWDPINNAWISPDAADFDFIHFINAMSLIDRGIYSTTTVMERKHKLFPCLEKHAKSFNFDQTMRNYKKYLLGMRTLKQPGGNSKSSASQKKEKHDFSLPELTSSEKPKSSSSIDWMLTTDHQDARLLMTQREQAEADCHSNRRHSTGSRDHQLIRSDLSDQRSTDESVDAAGSREDVLATNEADSSRLSIIDNERSIANPANDFINVDRNSSESEDGSDVIASTESRSGRLRKVRIGSGHQISLEIHEDKQTDQPVTQEKVNQRSLEGHSTDDSITQTQEKVNQRSLEGRSDPKDESKTVLPPLRNRFKIRATEDSVDEGDTHADRFRHRQKASIKDDQLSSAPSPENSDADFRRFSRMSRPSLPLIARVNRLEWETEDRNLSRKRQSQMERLKQRAAIRRGTRIEKANHSKDEDFQKDVDLRFEDYDWLAKYCILDPKTVKICRQIFDEVDENKTGKLSCMQTMVALRASNYKLSEMLEEYMYKIIEMTGYEIEHGSDYKLFAVLSALSLKIAALDDWMKCLIDKTDLKTLEEKLFVCKALWECTVDRETNTISLDDLCVELRAGGVSWENEQNVREKLEHLHHLDLFDFLTYVPLFIMIHRSVIENPLDDRRFK